MNELDSILSLFLDDDIVPYSAGDFKADSGDFKADSGKVFNRFSSQFLSPVNNFILFRVVLGRDLIPLSHPIFLMSVLIPARR